MTTERERERGDPSGAEPLARASVRVGDLETPYSVWGRGLPVVVLLHEPMEWAPPFWLEALAGPGRRLLFPEVPRPPVGERPASARRRFASWLGGFLDGLGLDQVEIACEAEFEPLVRAAQADDPDRFKDPIRWAVPAYRR